MIEYKGYTAVFEHDEQEDILGAWVIDTRDQILFEGRSLDELRERMKEAVDDYLEHCRERGKTPDKPYSGKFLFRTTADLHRAIATEAAAERMSINEWMEAKVRMAVRERQAEYNEYKTRDDPDE